ncbi:cytochrome p450 domain-containing protein [Sarocladium implicatum]|nr:cytochrome p450 domain-containing protein [Sarocladium implicatum]
MGLIETIGSSVGLGVAGVTALVSFMAWTLSKHDPRDKSVPHPIFTIAIPGQKFYIVTDPDLIQKIQKQHQVIAFTPLVNTFAARAANVTERSMRIIQQDNFAMTHVTNDVLVHGLKPGDNFDTMNRIMLNQINDLMLKLEPAEGETRTFFFNEWLKESLTTATTRALYDSQGHSCAQRRQYEKGLVTLMIGILPSITAKKPAEARDKIAAAFQRYYEDGGLETASTIAQGRYRLTSEHDVPVSEIAKMEVGMAVAVLLNTSPVTFWLLLLVHRYAGLRDEIRNEVDGCIETSVQDGITVKTIDILQLKASCPLLLSAYQETLRYSAIGTPVRQVTQDTFIDQYLLKKGAMVQMPTRAIHQDPSIYGPTATSFSPRRYLPSEKHKRPRDHCFRSFGGGKHLCPGRHFATNEVLATTAMFIARFDMEPVSGKWELPTIENSGSAGQIMEPDEDVEVKVRTRSGFEGVKWELRLKTADRIFAIVTEDVHEQA